MTRGWRRELLRLHEIKHDGIRVIARKQDQHIKLYSRPGNDLTQRFPQIVETLGRLRARSCILDGEAVACGEDGIASFDRIRYRRHDARRAWLQAMTTAAATQTIRNKLCIG